LTVEDPKRCLGHLEVVAVVELDEVVEGGGEARLDRGAAADPDLGAPDLLATDVLHLRDEADVVDLGDRPVVLAAGEGGLHLPRHELGGRVPDEVTRVRGRIWGDVEGLVLGDAGQWIARDVADRVAATLAGGEAGL